MTKIVLYIATSKDGFIADSKGSVDWLPQTEAETGGQDFGYHAFYETIDALAIGRKTYEQILTFGDWPYPGKPSFVFTRQSMKSPLKEIEFAADDIKGFIRQAEKRKIKNLWLVGGNELIEAFYNQGRIDEFIVTVFPAILKEGIPLTTVEKGIRNGDLVKTKTIDFGSGVFQNHYSIA